MLKNLICRTRRVRAATLCLTDCTVPEEHSSLVCRKGFIIADWCKKGSFCWMTLDIRSKVFSLNRCGLEQNREDKVISMRDCETNEYLIVGEILTNVSEQPPFAQACTFVYTSKYAGELIWCMSESLLRGSCLSVKDSFNPCTDWRTAFWSQLSESTI